jgi:hypothetical protein
MDSSPDAKFRPPSLSDIIGEIGQSQKKTPRVKTQREPAEMGERSISSALERLVEDAIERRMASTYSRTVDRGSDSFMRTTTLQDTLRAGDTVPTRERVDRMDESALLERLSKVSPKEVRIRGSYTVVENPVEATKHFRNLLAQNALEDLESEKCVVDRVREAMTETGELAALLKSDRVVACELARQMELPEPEVPESLMRLKTVRQVVVDVQAQSTAVLLWVASQHSDKGERSAKWHNDLRTTRMAENALRAFANLSHT